MTPTRTSLDKTVNAFIGDLDRANKLYNRIAKFGLTNESGSADQLIVADRRDAAQFIFFEAAGKFEAFGYESFQIELRHKSKMQPKFATLAMRSIDMRQPSGWADPNMLQSRGKRIAARNAYFRILKTRLGQTTWEYLEWARLVRNRIAHSGQKAAPGYIKMLNDMQISTRKRQGLSPGRLLMDYPENSNQTNKYFNRYIRAYRTYALKFYDYYKNRL